MSNGFDEYIAQARQFAEAGMVDDAIEAYRIALSEDPANEEIRREIINLSLSKGDYQQTIVEYFDWAEACQGEGAIDDSIRIYQEILGLPILLQKKVFMTDQDLANKTINQILETIQTASGAIFFNLGYLYLEKNALEESISCLQKSLEFNSADSKTHTLLGQVYMQMGNDNEAVREFQEVVRLAPEDAAYAYEMLGEIFIRKGKPPKSTVAWFRNAGDLYLRNNQMEEAIRAYERILTIEHNDKDVLKQLAEIYVKQGMIVQAVGAYTQGADLFEEAGMYDKVIIIYEKLAGWGFSEMIAREKISEISRKILERDPANLQARHKFIGNLLRMGATKDAIPEFIALSETYLKKGMKKEAFSVCRKLLELDPREARAHELIADIFYDQDKKEQALKEYMLVIKLYQDKGDDIMLTKLNEKLAGLFPETREVRCQLPISYNQQEDFMDNMKENTLFLDLGELDAFGKIVEMLTTATKGQLNNEMLSSLRETGGMMGLETVEIENILNRIQKKYGITPGSEAAISILIPHQETSFKRSTPRVGEGYSKPEIFLEAYQRNKDTLNSPVDSVETKKIKDLVFYRQEFLGKNPSHRYYIIIEKGKSNAFVLKNEIGLHYFQEGLENELGIPTSDERVVTSSCGTKALLQDFKIGNKSWQKRRLYKHLNGKRDGLMFITRGGINKKYEEFGSEKSPFGLPISNEKKTDYGARSEFENGEICWIEKNDSYEIHIQ